MQANGCPALALPALRCSLDHQNRAAACALGLRGVPAGAAPERPGADHHLGGPSLLGCDPAARPRGGSTVGDEPFAVD